MFSTSDIELQRRPSCPCGGGCPRCKDNHFPVHPKLKINEAGDRYEQESDRVADQVMRMPDLSKAQSKRVSEYNKVPSIQRVCTECEEEIHRQPIEEEEEEEVLQTKKASNSTPELTSDLESSIHTQRGGGQPFPELYSTIFGSRFGADFSGVRVHTDTQSDKLNQSLNARAFTTGQDIFFRKGEYNPGSSSGQELLAHELT
ncbi:MAG: DUF4157 domain-containing protein, partial [Thermodesulfobacteriota bacterium]